MNGWVVLPGGVYVKPTNNHTVYAITPHDAGFKLARHWIDGGVEKSEVIGTAMTPAAAAQMQGS